MPETIAIPDPRLRFQVSDREICFDPIETLIAMDEIAERHKDETTYAWLDDFRAWVKANAGADVSLSEADALWLAMRLERARTQKVFTDALRSLTFTASTPAD